MAAQHGHPVRVLPGRRTVCAGRFASRRLSVMKGTRSCGAQWVQTRPASRTGTPLRGPWSQRQGPSRRV